MQQLVIIGASTGGPGHLKQILKQLDEKTKASFIIAQHMNSNIIESFVSELSSITKLPIYAADDKTRIEPASIYICKISLEFSFLSNALFLESGSEKSIYTPSIDALFKSAEKCLPDYGIIAIILTGIGDDGMKGIDLLYKKGALCIAESSESAKVYGMPKAAYENNKNIEVMYIDKITTYLHNV
ncbi:chemotaxis protein CheB [Sulfurimonas sp.]